MKKIVILAMMLIGIVLGSCTSEDDDKNTGGEPGSIYGIVTRINSTEVLKGIQVALFKGNDHSGANYWPLILTTTTFDDGHYEFSNLEPGLYGIQIGYHPSYDLYIDAEVRVEAGRQARVDLQLDDK